MALFKTENLTFIYPDAPEPALSGISLEINEGEFILLMGKTGSGKSTLLKHFIPSIAPHGDITGEIEIIDKKVSYVPQNPDASFVSESVRGELVFALENQGLDHDTIALSLGETASFFNLSNMLDRNIKTLSGGERVTVAIAGAMIGGASAIILDEPIAQLDSKASYELMNLLRRVNDELGVTVVMSSHISDGVIDLCDRLLVLENGQLIFDNPPGMVDDRVLPFYPLSAKLFDAHPLTVKKAIEYAGELKEKPMEKITISEEMITLKNITFSYSKTGRDILDSLSFKAYKNKIHCIIGANASGKTTLLKVIAGIKKPYAGKVKIKGNIAYLPQNPKYLFTKDTVSAEIDEKTAKQFHLENYMNHHPYDLSSGQQQRLALAVLSKQDFDILLLDEPSKSLDVFYKKELCTYLKGLEKTIILVSHDLDFVGDVADYVSFLCDGVITLNGERRAVLSKLDFYTTQLRRITRNTLDSAVSAGDLL